jgi:hypothetical protein
LAGAAGAAASRRPPNSARSLSFDAVRRRRFGHNERGSALFVSVSVRRAVAAELAKALWAKLAGWLCAVRSGAAQQRRRRHEDNR